MPKVCRKKLQNLKLNRPVSIDLNFTSSAETTHCKLILFLQQIFISSVQTFRQVTIFGNGTVEWKISCLKGELTQSAQCDLRAVTNVLFLLPNDFCWLGGFFRSWWRVIVFLSIPNYAGCISYNRLTSATFLTRGRECPSCSLTTQWSIYER